MLGCLGYLVCPLLYNTDTDALKHGQATLSQVKEYQIVQTPKIDNCFATRVMWAIKLYHKNLVLDCLKIIMLDPRKFLNTEFLNIVNPLPKAEQAEFVEFLSSCVNSNSFSANQISQIYNI